MPSLFTASRSSRKVALMIISNSWRKGNKFAPPQRTAEHSRESHHLASLSDTCSDVHLERVGTWSIMTNYDLLSSAMNGQSRTHKPCQSLSVSDCYPQRTFIQKAFPSTYPHGQALFSSNFASHQQFGVRQDARIAFLPKQSWDKFISFLSLPSPYLPFILPPIP